MTIRHATASDTESITSCLLLAMSDIIYGFINEENPDKAKAFMLHFVQTDNNQYSYHNCRVAEIDGKVVAAVVVYDGALLHALRNPVIDYIKKHHNNNFDPEDETQAGEFYLDTIGVDPTHQGKGIGTQLLQFVINEYVTIRNHTLGLLVDDDNPNAKRLYLKLGFTSVGKKNLFGKTMEHLQVKSL